MNLHSTVNETAAQLVIRYRSQILSWFQSHDPSLTNILALARNLEKQAEIKDLRQDTVSLDNIVNSIVMLITKELVINKAEARELKKLFKSFESVSDSLVLRRKHRSVPMLLSL